MLSRSAILVAVPAAAVGRLDSLSPLGVLARGYALVQNAAGEILRRASQVRSGERVSIRLAEAQVEARVEAVRALSRT